MWLLLLVMQLCIGSLLVLVLARGPNDVCCKVPLVNIKTKPADSCHLSIRSEYRLHVINSSEVEIVIHAGTTLAGFGKGRFKSYNVLDEKFNKDKEQLFNIGTSEDLVIHLGVWEQKVACLLHNSFQLFLSLQFWECVFPD